MNATATALLDSAQPPVWLRPEQPADEAFLLELYGRTRQEELSLTNWDAATRAAFVKMQFNAMRRGYAGMFPNGQFSVVLLADRAVGRLVVHRGEQEICLADMALLPEICGRGIGTRLVQAVQAEARQAQKTVRLHVLKGNRAARLYERLGFRLTADCGIHDEMTWTPQ
jgi:ribosomal protein S18 acetylase RimI-like enzyme